MAGLKDELLDNKDDDLDKRSEKTKEIQKEGVELSLSDFSSTLDRIQFIIRIDDKVKIREDFQIDSLPGQFSVNVLKEIPKAYKVYFAGDNRMAHLSLQWEGTLMFDDFQSFMITSRSVFIDHVIKKGVFVFYSPKSISTYDFTKADPDTLGFPFSEIVYPGGGGENYARTIMESRNGEYCV